MDRGSLDVLRSAVGRQVLVRRSAKAPGALHGRRADRRGGPGGARGNGWTGAPRGPRRRTPGHAQGDAGDRVHRWRLDSAGAADRAAAGQGCDRSGGPRAARRQDRARHRRPGDVRLQGARRCGQARPGLDRARVQPRRRASVLAHHRVGDLGAVVPQAGLALRSRRVPGTVRACRRVPRPERLRGDHRRRRASPGRGAQRAQDEPRVARPRRPPGGDDGPSGRRRQASRDPLPAWRGRTSSIASPSAGNGIQLEQPAAVRTVKARRTRSLRRSPRSTSISSSRGDGLACIGAKRSTASSHCGAARRRGRAAVRRAAARPDARVMLLAGSRGTASPPLRMELAGDGGATAFSAGCRSGAGPTRAAGTPGLRPSQQSRSEPAALLLPRSGSAGSCSPGCPAAAP